MFRSISFLFLILASLTGSLNASGEGAGQRPADVALLQAAFGHNRRGVEQALKDGANPNVQDLHSGQTALMGAILRGHFDVVQYLLKQDTVDPFVPDKDGYTPVHGAAFAGRADIMRLLLKDGRFNLNDVHEDGYAPIHRACWGTETPHSHVVQFLRDEAGIDVHTPARDGRSCLDMTKNQMTRALVKGSSEL